MARFALIFALVTISVFQKGVSEEENGLEDGVYIKEDETRAKRYPGHLDPHFIFGWTNIGGGRLFQYLGWDTKCPDTVDGMHKYFCPTTTASQKWVCIDDYQLCDGIKNCPNAEDESNLCCMFYRAMKSNMELLATSVSNLNDKIRDHIQHTARGFEVQVVDETFVPSNHRQRGRFKPANL